MSAFAQTAERPTSLRGVLLQQMRTTHNLQEWFVPVDTAVAGLSAEQANWADGKGNHSVGQLVQHMLFWDSQELAKFKGEKPATFDGNNDETFNSFDSKQWTATVKRLDDLLTAWEKAIEAADEKTLSAHASDIAHVGTHNAYHIGQIVYVRKEQGSWDPDKGVKSKVVMPLPMASERPGAMGQ
jgi:uncharacterized damage-inducible protein DinB